jgi:outer membrane protein insertion porin family
MLIGKILLVFSACVCIGCAPMAASVIKEIKISGNVNIETVAILSELPVAVGDVYDSDTINAVLKKLYRTSYFEDLSVDINNGVIYIRVVENPIINKIEYEGMKYGMREELQNLIKLKPRQTLSKSAIQEIQQLILEILRAQGYLSASVIPKIVKHQNNRVDVVFEIREGSPTYVKKVTFIGNSAVSSANLREMLFIKEKKFYHLAFLNGTRNKIYDAAKFVEDQELLIRYYLSLGYADFEIVSATAELGPDKKDFFLTYYLNEGDIYKFGQLSAESEIEKLPNKVLQVCMLPKEGNVFNGELVELSSEVIRNMARSCGYNYAVVTPVLTKNLRNKTVDIKFVVREGPRVLIEKIDIRGNRVSRDRIIRRDLGFNEGDVFDSKLIKTAETRLKDSGFFKNVSVATTEGSTPDKVVVIINIEDDKRGTICGNLQYSTLEGIICEAKLSNNNFAGKAQQLDFGVSYSHKSINGSIELSDPYFLGRHLHGSIELFHMRSKVNSNVINTQSGLSPGIGYKISRFVSQHWSYRVYRNSIKSVMTETERQSRAIKDANKPAYDTWTATKEGKEHTDFVQSHYHDGVRVVSSITHTLSFDRRNRHFFPSKGFHVSLSTKLPCFSAAKLMVNTLSGSWHQKLYHDITLHMRASFAAVTPFGSYELKNVEALALGGESLRGFDFFGVSPARGLCRVRRLKAFDALVESVNDPSFANYVDGDAAVIGQKFIENKDDFRKMIVGESPSKKLDPLPFLLFLQGLSSKNHPNARQLTDLRSLKGKSVGGTRSVHGSFEITFPCPGLPSDAQVYCAVFFDWGAAWRAPKFDIGDTTSIINNDFSVRTSIGGSLAWKSPCGMIMIGYAYPIKHCPGDTRQRFLFGYGLNFS